ncbi:hypothetical protein HDU91_002781 [Kappamyces sp. JEL0680]|nr:hypothetical protein HDU91_002781 [Kappamyces sp. JEL0680]
MKRDCIKPGCIISNHDMCWIIAQIHIMSFEVGHSFALDCINEIAWAKEAAPSTGLSKTGTCSPEGQILILTLWLIIENDIENGPDKVKAVLSKYSCSDLAGDTARTCLLLLWKAGDACVTAKNAQKALAWYSVCLSFLSINACDAKNKAIIYRKIAFCRLVLGEHQEALDACLQSQALGEKNPLGHFLLFSAYFGLGDCDKALECLKCIDFTARSDLYVAAAELAAKVGSRSLTLERERRDPQTHPQDCGGGVGTKRASISCSGYSSLSRANDI